MTDKRPPPPLDIGLGEVSGPDKPLLVERIADALSRLFRRRPRR